MKTHEVEHLLGVLNSISNLCALEKSAESRQLLSDVAAYYRYKYTRSSHILPLTDEIEMLKILFRLAHARHGAHLNTVLNIQQDCSDACSACFVPHFSVLTFIENSLMHAPVAEARVASITTSITHARSTGEIEVVIQDDGDGFSRIDSECTVSRMVAQLRDTYRNERCVNVVSSRGAGTRVSLVFPL
ncbi:MAG: sensor histidine kinase [Spirochaetota bacterium]